MVNLAINKMKRQKHQINGDWCAVSGCSNNRRRSDNNLIKPHVGLLKWHSPRNEVDTELWEKALERRGKFRVKLKRTKVCSNHFSAGYYNPDCNVPTLFLKGYDEKQKKVCKPRKQCKFLKNSQPHSPDLLDEGSSPGLADSVITEPIPGHEYAVLPLENQPTKRTGISLDETFSFRYHLNSTNSWVSEEKLISPYPSVVMSYSVNTLQDGPIKVEELSEDVYKEKISVGRSSVKNSGAKRKRSFKCEICSKVFSRKGHLTSHIRIHGVGEKPFKCDECGKSFAKKSSLKDHHNVHSGDRPFVCSVCNQSFRNRDTLRGHKQKHNEVKPYSCKFCERTFTWRASLKKHEANHTNAKPFKCDKCAKAFFTKALLIEHDFSHSGISRHHCHICGVDFATGSTLRIHCMMLHEKDSNTVKEATKDVEATNRLGRPKRHQCDRCGQRFERKSKLVKHKSFQCYYVALEALKSKRLGVCKTTNP